MLLDMEQTAGRCSGFASLTAFEFSMCAAMSTRKRCAGYQYLNVEEDFAKALFVENGCWPHLRAAALLQDGKSRVLDYERASHIIRTASHTGVSMCYCRHKMQHLRAAWMPQWTSA